MEKKYEINEMAAASAAVFATIFMSVLFLTDAIAALKLSLFYVLLFFLPFLPLAYSFGGLNNIERIFISNILGLGYVGIYATLDVFFKVKLNLLTYAFVTLACLIVSSYLYYKSKN
jgi:hypothetical protein